MKLWKSPALYFGILLILVVSGALIAPFAMDWSRYRAEIEAYGSKLTGRQVAVEGPISVRLFPWPRLVIEDVRVANPKDAAEPYLLAAKRIDVRITLAGLFSGHIQVETVDVVEPKISLERLTEGQGSWQIKPASEVLSGRLLEHVKLDQITLTGGTVNLIDHSRHGRATLDHVEAVISAPGIAGPWRVRGQAAYKGRPIDIGINTGAWRAGDPFKFGFRIAPVDGTGLVYNFDGANDGKAVKGALRIEPAARPDGRSDPEGEFRPLVMTARVTSDFDTISLEKIEIAPRDATQGTNLLSGSAHLSLGPAIKLTTNLSASRFDLDAVAGAKARGLLRSGGGLALLDGLLRSLPDNVELDCSLKVASLVAGGATLDGVKLSFDIGDDAIHIRELSADMPGQSRGLFKGIFVTTDAGPQLLGDLAGEASNLREFVNWVWPEGREDVGRIWTGSRGRLKVETKVDAGANHLRLQDAAFQLEDSVGKGSFSLSFGKRPSIDVRLDANSLDFDGLVPNGIAAFAPSGQGWTSLAARLPGVAKDNDLRVAFQVGELRLNGVVANNVAVDIAANDKGLDVRTVEIGRVGDAKLDVFGVLAPGASAPTGSLSASVVAQDPRGLLQLLGIVPPGTQPRWTEALGETDLRVGVEFKPDEAGQLANLTVAGRSGPIAIDGMLSVAGAADWWSSEVSGSAALSSPTGAGLLKLAGLQPVVAQDEPAKLTLTATGSLKAGLLADIQAEMFGTRAQYQGNVTYGADGPRSRGRGGLFSERSQALLAALGVKAKDGVFSFESDVEFEPGKITFPAIKGMIAGAPASGALTIENGNKINGEFAMGRVELAQLLALAFMPWTGNEPDLEGPFSSGFPGGLTGELWIKPQRLDVFEGLSIAESQIGISADAKQIRLASAGKSAGGDDVQLEFGSKSEGGGRAIDARLTLPVDLSVALRKGDGKPVAAGPLILSARLESSGRSPAAAFADLKGSGTYTFSNASLRRINAARFADLIAKATTAEDVTAALAALLAEGEMAIGTGTGVITIAEGTAAFYPIQVKSPTADVTLTPVGDLANGSLDLSAKVQLKVIKDLPAMNVSYVGTPGRMTEIVDSNALESYLGFKVLERSLAELERLQREQQRIYEEEERARKEDEARLEAYYVQRRELQLRGRELKAHKLNAEIQAERAKAEAEQAFKEAEIINRREVSLRLRETRVHRRMREAEFARAKAEAGRVLKEARNLNRNEMNARVRELRVHRRMRLTADKQKMIPLDEPEDKPQEKAARTVDGAAPPALPLPGSPSGEALRMPLPDSETEESQSTATVDPFQPLVLVPPATQAPEKPDLFDIFTAPLSQKQWLREREQRR